jgi:hypothetical protein
MLPSDETTRKKWFSLVVKYWLLHHSADAIIMYAVCHRMPMGKKDVLEIIRKYVDSQTENNTYGKKKTT